MKKLLLLILSSFILILPVFSAGEINTKQLNQQSWEYIKKQDYPKAYNGFGLIYDNAKTQQDYEYIVYGFLELIKNNDISESLRLQFCDLMLDEKFAFKIEDEKLKNTIKAINFKMINIIANTNEDNYIFKHRFNQGKQSELKKIHDIYALNIEKQKDFQMSLLMFACYEYSIGNKTLGIKMFEYVKKLAKGKQKKRVNELISLVKELCR